ncbi:unnamed protein product [Adineta ricciae]|uniref:Fatty acid desaturase domain-containing protein n=1 Tax=Adineta ricciae TaxID=249248 RepID=A0A815UDU6_ADIRI|nr:unnamed protein product [Adineta ricciae]CAF1515614.1 unnamed protein product [Adineta ricciae]
MVCTIASANCVSAVQRTPCLDSDERNKAYVPYHKLSHDEMVRLRLHDTLINVVIVTYMMGGYVAALYLIMCTNSLMTLIAATILLMHTMIVALTLTHECSHSCIAQSTWLNHVVGEITLVISGALYVPFTELQRQHNEHHAVQVGIDSYQVSHILSTWPRWLQILILPLEACYIPVLSFISWWRTLIVPLYVHKYQHLRKRIVIVFVLRHTFFYTMWCIRPTSLVCYFAAHVLFIDVMRVYDAYHHTFQIVSRGTLPPKHDFDYEQQTTYSTVFGRNTLTRRMLDMIFLNYGYHNAHHRYPRVPWHRLQELDAIMYPKSNGHVIRLPAALKEYHRRRIDRITQKRGDSFGKPKLNPAKDADSLLINDYIGVVMNISSLVLDVDDYSLQRH